MRKFKEIKQFCRDNKIPFYEDNNLLEIRSCYVGDNFYNYDEEEKPIVIDDKFHILNNDWRIKFIRCKNCCECGEW